MKKCIDSYIEPLTLLINKSIQQGVFPVDLKIARIIPLYKGENNQLIHNYRPISVLPFFSKIFEKIVYKYVVDFLDDNNIFYQYQFSFRKHHSTSHAIITLVERVTKALDTGKYIVGVFLDLKKAFDTVDHSIWLKKQEKYGIRGNMHKWFKSYFIGLSGYNSLNTTIVILLLNKLHMECLRDQYSDLFYSFYISMTFLKRLIYCFQYYLQMTQVCSLRELLIAVS